MYAWRCKVCGSHKVGRSSYYYGYECEECENFGCDLSDIAVIVEEKDEQKQKVVNNGYSK